MTTTNSSSKGKEMITITYLERENIISILKMLIVLCLLLKGSNYVCHMNGYDKLSQYGLTIHRCIDEYIYEK